MLMDFKFLNKASLKNHFFAFKIYDEHYAPRGYFFGSHVHFFLCSQIFHC